MILFTLVLASALALPTVSRATTWSLVHMGDNIDVASGGGQTYRVDSNGNVWRQIRSYWTNISGPLRAKRICINDWGWPWIVTEDALIYEGNKYGSWWQRGDQDAFDIGCGGGEVYVTDYTGRSEGHIYRYVEGEPEWERIGGLGRNISVDSRGVPWLTNRYYHIFYVNLGVGCAVRRSVCIWLWG